MRRIVVPPILFAFSLLGCGSNDSSDSAPTTVTSTATETPTSTEASTTTVASLPATTEVTTTTAAPIGCEGAEDALAELAGEELGLFNCYGSWASYMPASYMDSCGDCESLWIAQWVADEWVDRGKFSQFSPLVPADLNNEIDLETSCKIWPMNGSESFSAKTGCPRQP